MVSNHNCTTIVHVYFQIVVQLCCCDVAGPSVEKWCKRLQDVIECMYKDMNEKSDE